MRTSIYLIILILCFSVATALSANEANDLSIVVTSLDITDKALKVQYEIRNDSEQDIWIFFGEYLSGVQLDPCCETYIAEDGQTLTLRSSLEPRIESEIPPPPVQYYGNYVRLRPGEHQKESIFYKIPFYTNSLTKQTQQKDQKLQYATRLAIELAYYPGNTIKNINRAYKTFHVGFVYRNEPTFSRNEQILILQHGLAKIDDPILRTVVNNLSIPYKLGRYKGEHPEIESLNLSSCVKIEFEYKPSIIKHLFPYPTQQNLLSPQEKEYLQSDKIVITDPNKIKIFANDVRKCTDFGGAGERYRSYIDVICHYIDKPPTSFSIYDDKTISIESEYLINMTQSLLGPIIVCYPETLSTLREIIPHIQEIDFRMQCAANMEDLWYRLCFYHGVLTKLKDSPGLRTLSPYPDPKTWCDTFNRSKKLLICPSAGEGKCHYAMNPNCDSNSPADMVLLFETKAGWNQHGGPELFTFDNHDPRGGCVLLNDGTVKFIRTEDELQKLRWKTDE